MWFSLFTSVLVLAITFYQGLLGLFTSAINCLLTILAAALAFGLYENVYVGYLIGRQPEEGRGIALMAIFFISLLVMRVIVDVMVKDNMKFPIYVDRIGGGILGFITAMVIIGVLCVSIQMLPFSFQFLTFSRYTLYDKESGQPVVTVAANDDKKTSDEDVLAAIDLSSVKLVRQKLWLAPDSFAIGLVSFLSDNALAGSNSMSKANPDLLDQLFWARFAPQGQNTSVARSADAITVEDCWVLTDDLYVPVKDKQEPKKYKLEVPKDDYELPSGYNWLAVRAKLSSDATDEGGKYRFVTGQVVLVTKGKGGATHNYHLVGINAPDEDVTGVPSKVETLHYRLMPGETVSRGSGRFDFVFEVPDDEEPWLIQYRTNARAEIRSVSKEEPGPFAEEGKAGKAGDSKGKGKDKSSGNSSRGNRADEDSGSDDGNSGDNRTADGSKKSGNGKSQINKHSNTDAGDEARSGGRTRRYSADEVGSFFGEELPFTLTSYSPDNVEVRSPKILGGGGRLTAKLDKDDQPLSGNEPSLESFDVPGNMRLLQVSVRRLHPGSTLAQAMDFARQLGNVSVKDEGGRSYNAVGTWGIATVRGERVFECVFFDETTRVGSSAPPKLDVIRRDDMNQNYALYYLFLIPPGKRIVAFEVPKGPEEDLRKANLVAPK